MKRLLFVAMCSVCMSSGCSDDDPPVAVPENPDTGNPIRELICLLVTLGTGDCVDPDPIPTRGTCPVAPVMQNIDVGRNTIEFSWFPPTTSESGVGLTRPLTGYQVLWGRFEGIYTDVESIDNPGLTRYVFTMPADQLAAGRNFHVTFAAVTSQCASTPTWDAHITFLQ